MTEKERQLLLKDLSARLPHGVCIRKKVCHSYQIEVLSNIGKGQITDETYINGYPLKKSLPYLRSMSSMTRDEEIEWITITLGGTDWLLIDNFDKAIDWLLAHHFDFRGLIPMGLALEAPEGMYKFE